MTRQLISPTSNLAPLASREASAAERLRSSRHLVRKSSTDEMRVTDPPSLAANFRFARDSGTERWQSSGLETERRIQARLLAGVRISRTTTTSVFPSFEC